MPDLGSWFADVAARVQAADAAAAAAVAGRLDRLAADLDYAAAPKTVCEYCGVYVRADRPTCSQCAAALPPPPGPGRPGRPAPDIKPDPNTMLKVVGR